MPTKKKPVTKRKRAVKKEPTRKTGTKKRKVSSRKTGRKTAEKAVLVCAHENECFWATDGTVIANLLELRDALSHMADEVYKYHVTKEKNDFATWVEVVLGDSVLAHALRKSRKPSSAKTVVVRRLTYYDI